VFNGRNVLALMVGMYYAMGSGLLAQDAQSSVESISSTESSTDQQEKEKVEKMEVTGSYIKRMDSEGPLPVQMIDRESLDQSGYNSVSDVLRDTTSSAFGSPRESSGSNAAGVATVNLRGLGSDRTLVLLDGKRMPADPAWGAVDLNLIPMAAVERIEILKDSASATYGSDALGGVVNIITKKEFTGSQISMRESMTKWGGGERRDIKFVTGHSTSKGNIVTSVNYRRNQSILSKDRKWSTNGQSTFSIPANYQPIVKDGNGDVTNAGSLQASTNCPDANKVAGTCRYDYSLIADEQPQIEQLNLFSFMDYDINEEHKIYAQVLATRNKVRYEWAPNASFFDIPIGVATGLDGIGSTTITGASATHIRVRNRMVEAGNRISDGETTMLGTQVGLKGYLSDTWEYDLTHASNRLNRTVVNSNGYNLTDQLNTLIANGDFNPLGAEGSRGSVTSAAHTPFAKIVAENESSNLVATGELFELNGNPVALAVGGTYTEESYSEALDAQSINNNVSGNAGASGGGSRTIKSGFAEFNLNPVDPLEIQLAGRYDSYSGFGETFNPKVGLRLSLGDSFMIRASAGTGFKAPTMSELFQAQSQGNPTIFDAKGCATVTANEPSNTSKIEDVCRPKQYNVVSGGNSGLKEEESQNYNIGLQFQPNRHVFMSVDYWAIELDNQVGLDLDELIEAEAAGIDVTSTGNKITRASDGTLISITALNQNLGKTNIEGIDLDFGFNFESFIGKLNIQINHSHMLSYQQETFPGLGKKELLGDWGYPRFRNNVTLAWTPSFHTKSHLSWLVKTIDRNKRRSGSGRLGRYTEVDFQYNLETSFNSVITAGVHNLLHTTPPWDKNAANMRFNESLYSPIGPSYYLQYTQNF
jgi:iron complex outermembrane receptor protein